MFLLENSHNKSSFDDAPVQSSTNHSHLAEAETISTVIHCVLTCLGERPILPVGKHGC